MILWPQNRHFPTTILAHQDLADGANQKYVLKALRDGSRPSSFDQPLFLFMDPPRERSGFGVEKSKNMIYDVEKGTLALKIGEVLVTYHSRTWWCTMFCCIDALESASLFNQHRAGMVLLGGPTFRKWIGINPLNTNHQVIFLHLHHFLLDAHLLDIHPSAPWSGSWSPRDRKEWSSVTPTIWWTCQLMVPRSPQGPGDESSRSKSWRPSPGGVYRRLLENQP